MMLRPRSIRARLTLWHAGILAAIVTAFSSAIFFFVRARLIDELDARLDREIAIIERTYRDDPGELREAESRAGIKLFEVVEDGALVYQTADWGQLQLDAAPAAARPRSAAMSWSPSEHQAYRIHTVPGPGHRISVAADESPLRDALRTLALVLALGIPSAIGLAIAGGAFLAGRVLAPIAAMGERARKITADRLSERLPVDDPHDEFGRLATIFNETLARLQDSFERLRRFTADASHELRTPLTALRSVGEVALHDSLDRAAYRDVIGSMLEEVQRLTTLVESLLLLTRAESGRLQVSNTVADLGSLTARAAEQLRVLAEEKQQLLLIEVPASLNARCDPALLRQAILNLVDNAIKYTPPGGEIHVGVRRLASAEAAIEVKDDGPGIAPLHRDRIFERFYRVDSARSRAGGGLGLGLALARLTVEAAGGRIEVESEEGHGSLFRILLPAVPDAGS
ncbi:MAG: HAMP domain-containing protein [Deltaproteobacteria bacterium]|nr:MAG: HAMP domain-containing protein [Deltaproteobacteria bacterium]